MNKSYPKAATIIEVGPRDGLQNEQKIVSVQDKIKFIELLAESGLKNIEVGSFVHPKWIPQLADSLEVIKGLNLPKDIICSALVPNMKGLERAKEAGIKRIAVFTACSETFNKNNINMTIKESLDIFKDVVKSALENKMTVRGYISTCFVCPYEGNIKKEKVLEVTKALIDMGVDEVSVGDTVGKALPEQIYDTVSFILKSIPKEKLALHLHNTGGRALENAEVGLKLGITKFDSSSGGLGGCPYAPGAPGNLATEDLVDFLNKNNIQSGVDLERLSKASLFMQTILGKKLPSKVLQRIAAELCHSRESRNPGNDIIGNDIIKKI